MTTNFSVCRTFVGVAVLLLGAAAFAEDASKSAVPASAVASWTLATDDTRLTVGVGKDQQMYLYELACPAAGWNWTSNSRRRAGFGL